VNPWASPYALFGILFWSNQSDDRRRPDPGAFLADPTTHKIDMSNYKFRGRMGTRDWVNFDFGFWDQTTGCFWHANHKDKTDDPMVVYQSTAQKFAKRFISAIDPGEVRYGYDDFDRVGYGVAQSNVYDPSKQKFLGTPVPTPAPAPPPNKPPPDYGPPPGS
jgi:hypothetical protein